MKIRMVTLYASAERSVQPGEEALFPNDEAEALIEAGFAVPVDGGQVRTRPLPQPPKTPAQPTETPTETPADTPVQPSAKTRAKKTPAKQDPPAGSEGQDDGGEGGATDPPKK